MKHVQEHEGLVCIGVDCRVDKDPLEYKEFIEENDGKHVAKTKGPELHLTFTIETGKESKYLIHRAVPNLSAIGVLLAEYVAAVLIEYNSVDTVKAVLVNNTSTNTGCEAGFIAAHEKINNKKLHTIGCSLHQNELPFREIFKLIDGTIRSPTTFSGPLGKLCITDYQELPQIEF